MEGHHLDASEPRFHQMVDVATEKKSTAWGKLLSEHRSPQAIAAGASFGIVLGLIPKDNLVALGLLIAIALLPVHHLIACAFATLGLLMSPLSDPWVHSIGKQVLGMPLVGIVVSQMYQWPLLPWTRLENTLVTGGLTLGVCLWLPHYYAARWIAFRAARTEMGIEFIELAAANVRRPKRTVKRVEESVPSTPARYAGDAYLSRPMTQTATSPSPNAPSVRPSYSDGISSREEAMAIVEELERVLENATETPQIERVLHETFIEVVRYKRPRTVDGSDPDFEESHLHSQLITNPMNQATSLAARFPSNGSLPSETGTLRSDAGHPLPPDMLAKSKTHIISHPGSKEEALRHLLKHIHGSRDARKEPEKTA